MEVVIFGATGMVGQGVLSRCLLERAVGAVLVVGRSPAGRPDAKMREIILGQQGSPKTYLGNQDVNALGDERRPR
jgi:nucleoside-diphosphate-sugar epimerase